MKTTYLSRRQLLRASGAGFGALALSGMLAEQVRATERASAKSQPLAPKAPHFAAKAKRIIFLFLEGAFSQLDTWEYKPELQAADGKPGPGGGTLVASKFKFTQHGQTGTWVSELFPHCARHVDKLCFLRGLHTDTPAHPQAVIQLHTGAANATLTRPSMAHGCSMDLAPRTRTCPVTSRSIHRLISAARSTMVAHSCLLITRAHALLTKAFYRICMRHPLQNFSANSSTISNR